jgi:hypothetical protein
MTRPRDLAAPFNAWAQGNFPLGANAWNATPKRVNPAGTELTPATTTPAQNLNALHGAALDTAQGALTMGGQAPSLNFPTKGVNTNNIKRGAFSAKDAAWFAVGDGGNDFGEVSYDSGRTWTNLALGLVMVYADVAVATAGHVAILTSTRQVIKGARTAYGAYTWTVAVNAIAAAPSAASLDFEASSGNFVACYRVGATGFKVDTTTDPAVTWTPRTLPSPWTAYTGSNAPEVTCAAGRCVAAFADASAQRLNAMYSSDGGVTWVNVQISSQALTAGYTGVTLSKPAYDSVRGEWFLALSTSGTVSTEVFRSTDGGVSWTSTFWRTTDLVFHDLQAQGDLLVATNSDGRAIYSIDRGATWKHGARLVGSVARWYLRAGGGGFMSWNSADKTTFASTRFGDPSATI